MPKELFDILEGHPFDGDHCFLCGIELDASNRTSEHVFPRWLQDAFGLRNQTINLLNKTRIAYRNLVIPCCSLCNGNYLSQLENRVRSVVLDDAKTLDEIDSKDLNAWISKIYIGILWKEMTLSFDRRNPDAGPILSSGVMANFRMVHMFMQSCRKDMTFHGLNTPFPNTIITTKCIFDRSYGAFDYLDHTVSYAVAIRMGGKGIFCVFDGGLHDYEFPNFSSLIFEEKALHPVQFKEVFSKIAYKSYLSLKIPYYNIIKNLETGKIDVVVMGFDDHNMQASTLLIELSENDFKMITVIPEIALCSPAYSDWSQEEYAYMLSMYIGIPFEEIFHHPDLFFTTLRDEDGKFIEM